MEYHVKHKLKDREIITQKGKTWKARTKIPDNAQPTTTDKE